MDFELDDGQRAILGAVEALLAKHAGPERAAVLARSGAYDTELDAALAAAGYTEVALAEGAGLLEAALMVGAVARAAGVAAVGAAALAVPAALGRSLPGPVALVDEACPGPVRFAGDARTLVALRGDGARALALAPGDAAPVATSFGYPMARVERALARAGEDLGPGAGARLRSGWRLALAVELAGTMQGAIDATVGYLRERRQFGRAIASFQAVQHRLAWCAVQAAGSRWLALEAAAHGAPAEACAVAAAHAALAAKRVFAETHQLSGAIGFTREHALHVWSMRLQALRLELGGAPEHARAAARALGLGVVSLALDFDEGERAIADAVARFCREEGVEARARAQDAPFPRALWRGLGELGVFAFAEPGAEGGAGALAAAFEALGAAACPGPLVAQAFAVRALPEPERGALARGEAVATIGAPPLFPFAADADVFVALAGDAAWLARPRGPAVPVASLAGEPLGRVEVTREAQLPAAGEARALSDLARAAWSAGAARRLLDVAVEHARTRRQFGRALGEFQAVAHPLAEVHIRLSAAEGLVRVAARAQDAGAADAALRTAAARLAAERAARRAVRRAHQTLGALGMTLEGPLVHLSRRLRQLAALLPDAAHAEASVLAPFGLGGP